MVTVAAITVLMLALGPSTMSQQQLETKIIVDCLEGDTTAGSPPTVCIANGICHEDTPEHQDRLFILNNNAGLKCLGNAGLYLDKCIVKIEGDNYTTLSDKVLNNLRSKIAFKGQDDDKEVWNLCTYLANNELEWANYTEAEKPVETSGDKLFIEYANGAYVVTAEAGTGTDKDKVAKLQYAATPPNNVPTDLAGIFTSLAFTSTKGCNVPDPAQPNTFNGVTYFVDDKALYTCAGQAVNAAPAFIGCLTEQPEGIIKFIHTKQMQYLPETDLDHLKALYTCIAFTYQAAKIPMDNIKNLKHKPLCKAIYDGLMQDESCLNVASPTFKPAERKSTAAGLAWFTPIFKMQVIP